MKRWILDVILLLLSAPVLVLSQRHPITIDAPRDRAEVPWRTCLSGITANPSAQLVAVVHPIEVSDYYVQPAITVSDGGRYEVMIYIGEGRLGLHSGKHFEIRVFSNPKDVLREGQKLPYWPTGEAASQVIKVVRRDGAPMGCSEYTPPVKAGGTVSSAVGGASRPGPDLPVDVAAPRSNRSRILEVQIATVSFLVLVVLFVVLATLPDHADAAVKRLTVWLGTIRSWLVEAARYFKGSVERLSNWLIARGFLWAEWIWKAKGHVGDLRQFALSALMVPLLAFATVLAFYGDARTISKGLYPLFGVEDNQAGSNQTNGVLASLMPAGDTLHAEAEQQLTKRNADSWHVSQLFDHLVKSFETLWAEKFGFLAIALAGLQGAFGTVLLWRMGADQPVRLRPLALLKERLLLTTCFLILNFALSVLAANRGFEVSPNGVNWVMPSLVSGAIALVMPWIMTFTQHYAIECAADCLGVAKAVSLITGLIAMMFTTISAWVVLSVFVLGIVGAVFVTFFLLCVAAGAFLLFAQVVGVFVRKLPWPSLPELRPAAPLRAVSAALVSLVLVGGGYYLIRGLVQ